MSVATFRQLYIEFFEQRTAAKVTKGTLAIYGYTLIPFCHWADEQGLDPAKINRQDVGSYIQILSKSDRKKATVDLHGRNIRAMIRFGELEGLCPSVNFHGLLPRPPKKKQIVARSTDVEKLLAHCTLLRDRAVILAMFESGIRRRECSNLNWCDLDFTPQDVLRIRVKSGKGDKDRVTFSANRAKAALTAYQATIPHGNEDPVFLGRFERRLGIQGIDRIYKKYRRLAGIKITPHAMRRGFAVEHRDMSIWDLQRLMGHASVETTRLYVQTDEDDLLDSYRAHLTA